MTKKQISKGASRRQSAAPAARPSKVVKTAARNAPSQRSRASSRRSKAPATVASSSRTPASLPSNKDDTDGTAEDDIEAGEQDEDDSNPDEDSGAYLKGTLPYKSMQIIPEEHFIIDDMGEQKQKWTREKVEIYKPLSNQFYHHNVEMEVESALTSDRAVRLNGFNFARNRKRNHADSGDEEITLPTIKKGVILKRAEASKDKSRGIGKAKDQAKGKGTAKSKGISKGEDQAKGKGRAKIESDVFRVPAKITATYSRLPQKRPPYREFQLDLEWPAGFFQAPAKGKTAKCYGRYHDNRKFRGGQICDCVVPIWTQYPDEVFKLCFIDYKKGLGIRAARPFQVGDVLGEYLGELRLPSERRISLDYVYVLSKLPNAPKVDFEVDSGTVGNWTRFVNHDCKEYNVEFVNIRVGPMVRPVLQAKRYISIGDEVLCDYGPGYYSDGPSTHGPCPCGGYGHKRCQAERRVREANADAEVLDGSEAEAAVNPKGTADNERDTSAGEEGLDVEESEAEQGKDAVADVEEDGADAGEGSTQSNAVVQPVPRRS